MPRNQTHFDAGGKFHVPNDYSYMAYFVAHIAQFQIYRSLCIAAGQYDPENQSQPLHKCDIQDSILAGNRLRDGLSLGKSKHWSEVLKVITNGETELSADAILEYFAPLQEFLKKENEGETDSLGLFLVFFSSFFLNPSKIYQFNLSIDSFIYITAPSSKLPWILGGFALLVAVVALIAYAIYYYNRK